MVLAYFFKKNISFDFICSKPKYVFIETGRGGPPGPAVRLERRSERHRRRHGALPRLLPAQHRRLGRRLAGGALWQEGGGRGDRRGREVGSGVEETISRVRLSYSKLENARIQTFIDCAYESRSSTLSYLWKILGILSQSKNKKIPENESQWHISIF